jgi:two-component system response regulator FixJ
MTNESTVFVVDDNPELCESMRYLLESDGLSVETYTSAEHFLGAYRPERPGVLILDVRMPVMSGVELQEHLISEGFMIPVIVLTGHGDVPLAVQMMKAGAIDFFQKPVSDGELLGRVHEAMELDVRNRKKKVTRDVVKKRLKLLTTREREVLDLIILGRANKQMADELCVATKTIEVHRKRLLRKMEAGSAVELVYMVLSSGALDDND